MNKVYTVGEFIDAIEKNGLEKTMRYYFGSSDFGPTNSVPKYSSMTIESACAMGQAAINLGIDAGSGILYNPDLLELEFSVGHFFNTVAQLNDDNVLNYTFKKIANQLRARFADDLNIQIESTVFDYTPYLKVEA